MSIKTASVSIVYGLENPQAVMHLLETAGRISHASGDSKSDASAESFVRMIIKLGHESVLEHACITVRVVCDRATAQQWLRHRLASYTMESQRYVSYKEIDFIDPEFKDADGTMWTFDEVDDNLSAPAGIKAMYGAFEDSCCESTKKYRELRDMKVPPEDARSVLPNCTKTVFFSTANIRSWRHFFNERCQPAAQHNIRKLALSLLDQMHSKLPACFQDIYDKYYGCASSPSAPAQ